MKFPPFLLNLAIDISIVLVLSRQPFPGKTMSQQTSWNSGSYHLSAPLPECFLSHRHRNCNVHVLFTGAAILNLLISACVQLWFLLWLPFSVRSGFFDEGR